MKPENLLYLSREPDSELVLADFGIAKMLDAPGEVLTTMAGSFGYAAPEVMLKQGHGKAVDMWSLGVITYTLLCGYSPFRSETLAELVEECRSGRIIFHERYWKDVSKDAKEFIMTLLQPDPKKRATSAEALKHRWLEGETASDHDLLPEIRSYMAKAKFKRGIELIKLANRIERLKVQEDKEAIDEKDASDIPEHPANAAAATIEKEEKGDATDRPGLDTTDSTTNTADKKPPVKTFNSAIFKEIAMAKIQDMKNQKETEKLVANATAAHERKKSFSGQK